MNTTGTIEVIPTSGLANRLRVMAFSIKLARESNKKIILYWHADKYLNANFDDLFELPDDLIIKKLPLKFWVWLKISNSSAGLNGISKWYLDWFHFDFIFLDNMANEVWQDRLNLQCEIDKSKKVFICSCQEINYFNMKDYQLFVPKPDLMKTIESLTKRFNQNTIGIHIRSTDNEESKKNSPFEIFLKRMEEEIRMNEDVTFFLSTDNKNYQSELLKRFGAEKIIFHEKEFSRNKKQGIKDAVVDLFCLSKTSKIYGSYFSSFSAVAGRIGEISNEVLKIGVTSM